MTNIKSYKDGARLILVIENCTGELARKCNAFLADVVGIDADPEPIPALVPLQIRDDPPPDERTMEPVVRMDEDKRDHSCESRQIPSGPYQGLRVKDALLQHGVKAAIDLIQRRSQFPELVRDDLLAITKKMIYSNAAARNPDTASLEEIRAFFSEFQPLIVNSTRQILEMAGYSLIADFLDFAPEHMQQDAYYSVLDELKRRTA